jgi:hypothetical protein
MNLPGTLTKLSAVYKRGQPHGGDSVINIRKTFLRDILRGSLIAVLLIGTKFYLESETEVGYRVQLLATEFLLGRLPTFSPEERLPVLVVDISRVPGGKEDQVTPRSTLEALIGQIASYHPSAIAVDIDFSPNETGWMTPTDPQFFDFCQGIRQEMRVPIFLGVHRASNKAPAMWLGLDKYKNLAASMDIVQHGRTGTNTRMPRLIATDGISVGQQLPSMSFALARGYGRKIPGLRAPHFLRGLLKDASDPQYQMLINYSKLDQLRHETIPATSPVTITDFRDFFPAKMVILGDVNQAIDQFQPPGFGPTPGIYAHAAAAYSFAVEPLFEFTTSTRLVLDLAISIFIVVGVAWKRSRDTSNRGIGDGDKRQARFIWGMVLIVTACGILLVSVLHIMWLDFALVSFALLLHPSVERWVDNAWKKSPVRGRNP